MFEVRGGLEMEMGLNVALAAKPADALRALYRQAERIMAISKSQFVPVRRGTLKNTGHVRVVSGPPSTTLVVELVYGGPAAPYAYKQHETPHYHHPVGQWKYLETPLLQAVPGLPANLAADLQFE